VTTSGAELSVHCPTHKIALALCALLKSNLIRLKKPGMSVLH
jgi:tRNA A37 threonylcarbamoyladenosine synthetase subunit TsaC/SUA5/YrdC